jgi:tetratricopeptide (TPR) repeat protein
MEPKSIDRIFWDAAQLTSPEECARYLDRECGDDSALRQKLERFLKARSKAATFLESPAADLIDTPFPRPVEPSLGTAIGPYRILEHIGEGGMGTVFLAEQEKPVRRKVAIKVIKAGMDTRQVVARFEAERQAFALMEHPNIAKVFDAGTTLPSPPYEGGAVGRPYFVMELVKGARITEYCDQNHLSLLERLELFIPVCHAIQHAHQKGIIHRDIKPSNILVTQDDPGAPGVPKVIDFGVAKAIDRRLTEKTLLTEFGAVIGTLEYMSPEQAELGALDIDTRSDIYSLGVLLYELLTGSTPLESSELRQAAYSEILRRIREEEPAKPSTRLSELKNSLSSIAALRRTEPATLTKLVRGELDWIVMKALEKDRSRRYETASGFARDIERYLRDEPVQAGPPSAWYRFRKFARRNRAALAVAAATLFVIALAGGGAGWVFRDRAARQAREANDLELAVQRGEMLQRDGKRPEAQAALEQAERLASRAPADPSREARLANLKERLAAEARDQGFIASFEDIRLRVQTQFDNDATAFSTAAAFPAIRESLRRYGIEMGATAPEEVAARVQGRPEAVRRELIAALVECSHFVTREETRTRQWLLDTLAAADDDSWRVRVRQAYLDRDYKVVEQLAREAEMDRQPTSFLIFVARGLPGQMSVTRLQLFRRIQRAHPGDLWANNSLAFELANNGQPGEAVRYYTAALALRPNNPGIYFTCSNALRDAGEIDAAIAHLRAAIHLQNDFAAAHCNLGSALTKKGQLDEAIAELREAIRLKKDFPVAHFNLGVALRDKGQLNEAIAAYREAIRLKKDFAVAHCNLGVALQQKGQPDEAIAAYREAIRFKEDFAEAHSCLGYALEQKGQVDEAIAAYREAIRLKKDFADAHYNLGCDLTQKGQLDEAIAELREAIRLKKDFPLAHCNLGCALQQKGQVDEAIAAYREAIRLKKDFPLAHYDLGLALQQKGQSDEAIAAYREAIRLKEDFAEAHCNFGLLLRDQGLFGEALAELQTGHKLGSQRRGWHNPSAAWVSDVERLVEFDAKLTNVLKAESRPADARERLQLAFFCQTHKQLYAAAAAWYGEAFAAEPKSADDLKAGHRYHAACAAALAGSGRGRDSGALTDDERARLRRHALDWLRADLALHAKRLQGHDPQDRTTAEQQLTQWQRDQALIGIRDCAALAKLPGAERAAFVQLWADVDRFASKVTAKSNARPHE